MRKKHTISRKIHKNLNGLTCVTRTFLHRKKCSFSTRQQKIGSTIHASMRWFIFEFDNSKNAQRKKSQKIASTIW